MTIRTSAGEAGPAVDSHGLPVQDPTKNVLQLTEAANKRSDDLLALHVRRLDDLRNEDQKRQDELRTLADSFLHQLSDVRTDYNRQLREADFLQQRRKEDLRSQESSHVRELLTQSSRFQELLRDAETKRIDAIRMVDVGAVAETSKVSAAQALTLATQVTQSADALRGQVAAVATATAAALTNALEPIQKTIEDLRKTQYEAQGVHTASIDQRSDRQDTRSLTQWAVGLAITVVLIAVQILLHYAPVK